MRWLLGLFWIQAARGEREWGREILWESGSGRARQNLVVQNASAFSLIKNKEGGSLAALLIESRVLRPATKNSRLRVGTALESWPVVVGAVGVVAGGLLLGLFGFGAQRGFARGVIAHFAREHDVAEAGLHGIEFGSSDDVLLPGGQNARNLFLRVFDALGRRRMRGENLGDAARAALFIGLDALEESDVGVRVVAGLIHVLESEEIGFTFGVAAELQVGHGDRQVQALINAVAGPAAGSEQNQRDGGELHQFALGGVFRAVTGGHVGNLVGHNAGKLRLFHSVQDQAAVHVEEAAGQCEGVDFVGIDHLDGEGNSRIGIANQVLTNAVDVFGDHWIVNEFRGALDFLG